MASSGTGLPAILPHVQVLPLAEHDQKDLDALPGMEAACTAGNLDTVHELHCRWLASMKPDPRLGYVVRPWLRGAVGRAIENDHAVVLSYFLSNGYRISPIDNWASTEIARAVEARSTACLQAFLDRGWNINERTGGYLPAALRYAIHDREMMEWFLAHKASPNATCDMDITPLSHACQQAPLDSVKLLFERGGSIEHGQLLHWAVLRDSDSAELLDFLLDKGMPINAIEFENCPDIYWVERWKGLGTALHKAARKGNVEAVKVLLARGADPLIKDSKDHGRLAKDWANSTLSHIRLRAAQEANPTRFSSQKVTMTSSFMRECPPKEEDLLEIIRLLEPSWWSLEIFRDMMGSTEKADLTEMRKLVKNNKCIPAPGEVDFISAGSPCQVYSLINSRKSGEKTLRNCPFVASVAVYVDFYHPENALLENVVTMANTGKKSQDQNVSSQTICCLVGMGYQDHIKVRSLYSATGFGRGRNSGKQ
ncbi:MAG: hypothetical protein M1837_002549 [Sclerophora amabilis]|nr:MAG: hypothetical protein M1837_002549 [Sclerophora amabilis]